MLRGLHVMGLVSLSCAFVLLLLVSISLPWLTALDFVRVHFNGGRPSTQANTSAINEIRFGSWADCFYETSGNRVCPSAHNAYTTTLADSQGHNPVTIGASWTRGLAIHPVACVIAFIACALAASPRISKHIAASLVAFLAAIITLIAFAVDIALYAWVKHQMGKLNGASSDTDTAPAFWMTFVAFLLLLFGTFTVCWGRHKERGDGSKIYRY